MCPMGGDETYTCWDVSRDRDMGHGPSAPPDPQGAAGAAAERQINPKWSKSPELGAEPEVNPPWPAKGMPASPGIWLVIPQIKFSWIWAPRGHRQSESPRCSQGKPDPCSGVLRNAVLWDLVPPVPRREGSEARGAGGYLSLGTPHKPSLDLPPCPQRAHPPALRLVRKKKPFPS